MINPLKTDRKKQGRKVVEHPATSNQIAPIQEAQMTVKSNMGNPPLKSIPDNWKPLGELARKLLEKAADQQ